MKQKDIFDELEEYFEETIKLLDTIEFPTCELEDLDFDFQFEELTLDLESKGVDDEDE